MAILNSRHLSSKMDQRVIYIYFRARFLWFCGCNMGSPLFFCLLDCQGSDGELRGEKDGLSDNESKVDSGVPEVPVPADDTPVVLNKALSGLSSRYC